jgi:hypothetical protein
MFKQSPLLLALSLGLASVTVTTVNAAGVIMPVYGNTASQYNAAIAAAKKVALIAVINPDDGVGSKRIGSVATFSSRIRSGGDQIFGYINTFYGGEALSDVYSQVDKYRSWYSANGVYLDEMSDRTGKVGYYRSIYNYVRGQGMQVIGNPGTFVPSGYAAVCNIIVTYEDPLSGGWKTYRQSGWTGGYPASKFAAIVYSAPASSMQSIVDRAVSLRFGWVFATDGGGGDPFGRAPSYMSSLADYVKTK